MSWRKSSYRSYVRLRRRLLGIPQPGCVDFGDRRRPQRRPCIFLIRASTASSPPPALYLIYDARTAVSTLHRSLKPGGVLLLTLPGITQVACGTD